MPIIIMTALILTAAYLIRLMVQDYNRQVAKHNEAEAHKARIRKAEQEMWDQLYKWQETHLQMIEKLGEHGIVYDERND
tara:strand:+ start:226 stop:462 length:237 start_codon:yes stop_codon:yes gene_type:complete